MVCPYCKSRNTLVKDSRQHGPVRHRKYRCKECGKRFGTRECVIAEERDESEENRLMPDFKYTIPKDPEIGKPCLICEETVRIADHRDTPKICEKCKAAVMKLREKMDLEEQSGRD